MSILMIKREIGMTENRKEELKPKILSVKDVLSKKNLSIPDYQRTYSWSEKHVQQLLMDIKENYDIHQLKEDKKYRLGAVVVHKNNSSLDIVDGQQRLTTLTILLNFLKYDNLSLLKVEYEHSASIDCLVKNKKAIEQFLSINNLTDSDSLRDYILTHCQLVYIELDDIEEAFQFFDSQNSRGKPLAPYDLLKAYHLREVEDEQAVINECVTKWEAAVDAQEVNLDVIISQILFRLRKWNRKESGEMFTNNEIGVFKGVNPKLSYPYLQGIKANDVLYNLCKQNPFMLNAIFHQQGFQIPQSIINGRLFFNYIQQYIKHYEFLFHRTSGYLNKVYLNSEAKNVLQYLNSYTGHTRSGDKFIRILFECLVMRYYDKFGMEQLELAIKYCLRWAYSIRLNQSRIDFSSIAREVKSDSSLLIFLEKCNTPSEFFKFTFLKEFEELSKAELKHALIGYNSIVNLVKWGK